MTEKELRRLKRADLIEIIYKQQKIEQRLNQEIQELQAQLSDRRIRISQAGTLAEAAFALSGVLDAAQKAADIYIEEIRQMHLDEIKRTGAEKK